MGKGFKTKPRGWHNDDGSDGGGAQPLAGSSRPDGPGAQG
jgi:hypothetical protein